MGDRLTRGEPTGMQRPLDVRLRKYIPWLFFLSLVIILVGQGTGVVRTNTLPFRLIQAAPIAVIALWLALKASAVLVVKARHSTGSFQRTAIWAWGFLLLLLAAVLGGFAVRVLAVS